MKTSKPRKLQERTAVTRELLLRAAEQGFAKVGYEAAQTEQIAVAAGYSKGALYAHFKSKEELFLALYEAKTAGYKTKLRQILESASTLELKREGFRGFYIDLSRDWEWALIVLEVKLFIRRHPEARARLQRADDSVRGEFVRLFGESFRAGGEALGGIFSALVLESDLEPEVLPGEKMREILGKIFDALVALPID